MDSKEVFQPVAKVASDLPGEQVATDDVADDCWNNWSSDSTLLRDLRFDTEAQTANSDIASYSPDMILALYSGVAS